MTAQNRDSEGNAMQDRLEPFGDGSELRTHEHVYRCQDCGEIGTGPNTTEGGTTTMPESPFDHAYYEASQLTLSTIRPGVEYTLVRNNDNSDHGTAECFFADPSDARRYARRLNAAHEAGTLGNHFHPAPLALNFATFTVTRWT